ncbi:MAG: hypothetical protein ACXIUM_00745 [Wenzhouxiangella sp.]
MTTFAEIQAQIAEHYKIVHTEPFVIAAEVPVGRSGRRQDVFLAELKNSDDRRILRIESNIAPLAEHQAEKCLRVNLMLRIGYLAVGDLEGVPFIKLCHNLTYDQLQERSLLYFVEQIARLADGMEETLTGGSDHF